MVYKEIDYNSLLDDLRMIAQDYYINNQGIVVDRENNEINDEDIIIKTKFYSLYCIGYKKLAEEWDGCSLEDNNEGIITRALKDYNTFTSFLDNSIAEYNMYHDVGTGYISYNPNKILSKAFFEPRRQRKYLLDYMQSVVKKFLYDKGKRRVKII